MTAADAWPAIELDRIDSTNAEALRRARSGETGPLWIRANEQSQGRGRQGKDWTSTAGNLYCTLLLNGGRDPQVWTQLSFVAGLSVFDAAEACLRDAGQHTLALKWPNDLLLDGRKASGILLESTTVEGAGPVLAIGIGLNIGHSPAREDLPYGAAHLASVHPSARVEDVFSTLRDSFRRWHGVWDNGRGFDAVRETWKSRAHGIGETVHVNMPGERVTGLFSGLDDDGAMVLVTSDGETCRVLVGELFLAAERAGNAALQSKGCT